MNFRHAFPLVLALVTSPALCSLVESPPPDLLRGPEVTTVAHDSNLGMLSSGAQRRSLQRDAVPVRRWFSEFELLELTPEQHARFVQLKDEFNAKATAFKREHGERMKEVRNALRALGETDRSAPVERVRALQDEQTQFERDAPKVQFLQVSCWGLLDRLQQDDFREQLAEIRAQIRRQRVIERMREESSMQEGAMQDGAAAAPDAAPMQGMSSDGYN